MPAAPLSSYTSKRGVVTARRRGSALCWVIVGYEWRRHLHFQPPVKPHNRYCDPARGRILTKKRNNPCVVDLHKKPSNFSVFRHQKKHSHFPVFHHQKKPSEFSVFHHQETSSDISAADNQKKYSDISIVDHQKKHSTISAVDNQKTNSDISAIDHQKKHSDTSTVDTHKEHSDISAVNNEKEHLNISVVDNHKESSDISAIEYQTKHSDISAVDHKKKHSDFCVLFHQLKASFDAKAKIKRMGFGVRQLWQGLQRCKWLGDLKARAKEIRSILANALTCDICSHEEDLYDSKCYSNPSFEACVCLPTSNSSSSRSCEPLQRQVSAP